MNKKFFQAVSFPRFLALFLLAAAAQLFISFQAVAQTPTVSIFVVRHAEVDLSSPVIPLSDVGHRRAEQLAQTVRGIRFTHFFSSHTTRSRQMLDATAQAHGLPIVQLPEPGSTWNGEVVTEQTSRQASIEPIATALLALPAGSVAIVSLNSDNIYGILHALGIPLAEAGQGCDVGVPCVPCTSNSCFPQAEFDHLWHLVIEPGVPAPLAFAEIRYAAGWHPDVPR